MQYRKFGNTGVNISALGFGCMRLPEIEQPDGKFIVDQEKTDAMLRHAYDLGVNYFDTAFFYCHENSEIAVGKALKPIREIWVGGRSGCSEEWGPSSEGMKSFGHQEGTCSSVCQMGS